jgi:hypothetical protein
MDTLDTRNYINYGTTQTRGVISIELTYDLPLDEHRHDNVNIVIHAYGA